MPTGELDRGSLPWLALVAAAALLAGGGLEATGRLAGLCGAADAEAIVRSTAATLGTFPAGQLAAQWALMVLSMMPPLAAPAVNHVAASTPRRRRARAIGVTLLVYCTVWMAAGAALLPLSVALAAALHTWALPASVAAAAAWSCSPAGQRALDRCHRTTRIAMSGAAADRDCMRQGVMAGVPCLLACWPWMAAIGTAGEWHLPAMVLAACFLLLERMAPAAPARWGPPRAAAFASTRRLRFRACQRVAGTR